MTTPEKIAKLSCLASMYVNACSSLGRGDHDLYHILLDDMLLSDHIDRSAQPYMSIRHAFRDRLRAHRAK